MADFNTFLNEIKNDDAETMYNNFRKIVGNDGRGVIIDEIDEDMEHFIEDENDDRRLISIGIFEHKDSNTLFQVVTKINNDRMNFNVMDFSIGRVTKSEKTITVYE